MGTLGGRIVNLGYKERALGTKSKIGYPKYTVTLSRFRHREMEI